MEGITTASFCSVLANRELVRCWITPFVRISTGVPRRAKLVARLAPFRARGLPVFVQLMGTDIALLSAAARRVADLGVAGIDLNCACPSRAVTRGGAGGACLREPRWIVRALASLRQACAGCGLSVKLRTGWASPSEMDDLLPCLGDLGLDFVVLHFRTVGEAYGQISDGWARLARARELLPSTTLIGSGDLFSAEAALGMFERSGVDGVAPARGILRNPWLLRDIETRCSGHTPPGRTLGAVLGVLHDIACQSQRSGNARPGFVLELAKHILGPEHVAFRRLARCHTLLEAIDTLRDAAAGWDSPMGGA